MKKNLSCVLLKLLLTLKRLYTVVYFLLHIEHTVSSQLQTEDDLIWLREKLQIGKTEEEAAAHFREKIEESRNCERTMLNNFFHIMKHR